MWGGVVGYCVEKCGICLGFKQKLAQLLTREVGVA